MTVPHRSNPRIWNRRLHRRGAVLIALPFLVVLVTGLLLQVKKQVPWVQPPEVRGLSGSPTLSLPEILEIVRGVPEAGISGWDDIDRVDVRPAKGMMKVIGMNRWEIQVDASSGAVRGDWGRDRFGTGGPGARVCKSRQHCPRNQGRGSRIGIGSY